MYFIVDAVVIISICFALIGMLYFAFGSPAFNYEQAKRAVPNELYLQVHQREMNIQTIAVVYNIPAFYLQLFLPIVNWLLIITISVAVIELCLLIAMVVVENGGDGAS